MFKGQKQPDDDYDQADIDSEEGGQNDYGSEQYWQKRYIKTKGQRFDWLQSYDTLKNLIMKQIGENKNVKILNVGCGNGLIQDHLYEAGYQQIWNNDISKQVIRQMNEIAKGKKQQSMIYQVMDVTKMSYTDKFFDVVLDKSTLDALLCSQHPFLESAKMLQQIERVLKDNGLYLAISYGDSRLKHFKRQHISFDVKIQQLVKLNQDGHKIIHYAYICRKLDKPIRQEKWRQQFYANLLKEQNEYYGVVDNHN